MAQDCTQKVRQPEDQWVCSLSASPDRVRARDMDTTANWRLLCRTPVTTRYRLTQKRTVYNSVFTFSYDGTQRCH